MRKRKKWLAILCLLLALIFLPQIASTPLVKPLFIRSFEEKSGSKVEIGSLKLSWFGPQIFRKVVFHKNAATASFEELQIIAPFWRMEGLFELKNGEIAYRGGKVENIEGHIEGNDFSLTGITMQGHLALKGQIYSKLHFHIQIDVKNFPLLIIDQKLDEILGPTLDLLGTVSLDQKKGFIDLTVASVNLKTHIQGNLTPEGITLAKPLDASIRLTQTLSALLLKDANPLFITALAAQNPVSLRIEKEGFFFPLPYSLAKLKIGKAVLNLGKVQSQNGPTLINIVQILNANRFGNASQMEIWFTPVTLQLEQGVLTAGRLDALLANSIHICTWGKIDLIKDRLDMTLGLPADTLKQSFGIKHLPPNYVLKIEVKGSSSAPEINKGAAAAKIAALIAKDQVPQKGIFGGIVDFFAEKEASDTPPPSRPLPWEK